MKPYFYILVLCSVVSFAVPFFGGYYSNFHYMVSNLYLAAALFLLGLQNLLEEMKEDND